MSNKQLKKFCSLAKYIEQIDKDLFHVFDKLCIVNYLRPMRGTDGITFLYPKEKSYRQKIINAAFSPNPEVAIAMIRSLILHDFHESPSSFSKNAVNRLNQKLVVKEVSDKHVKLANGLELTKDKNFVPLNRDNMAVYIISGKGEIPLNEAVIAMEKKVTKTGGFIGPSSRDKLHTYLKETFVSEMDNNNNVYVKKVYLQLQYILGTCKKDDQGKPKSDDEARVKKLVVDYLGNDEFSDSYLLDMYCLNAHYGCFEGLLYCFQAEQGDVSKITREHYIQMKASFITDSNTTLHSQSRLNNLQTPMDIRQRVFELYGGDKERIGRDLFIVFCNVCRDLWNTDTDKVSSFKNFAYLVSKVYTTCADVLNQEFDIARDLTLYGNLLKSDVFMFYPQASYDASTVTLPIPKSLPSPLEMNLYSLSGFINLPSQRVSGGSGKYKYLLEGL
jgi:hypothetical protein